MYCIFNHRLTPAEKIAIPSSDRGFRYGDGVFETIAVHGGAPWRLGWHLNRLKRGLAAARIAFPADTLEAECRLLLQSNKTGDALLRIQVTRGAGGRGYLPDAAAEPLCLVETLPMPEPPAGPVTLWLSAYEKPSAKALPVRYKLCQGLNSTLARMEASDHGCFDALLLNADGEICETSSANVFWAKNGTLHTPPLECGAVEGSARAAVLELSPVPVRETRADLSALQKADAVFLTNVAWKAVPVARLLPSGGAWDSAAAAKAVAALLAEDVERQRRAA